MTKMSVAERLDVLRELEASLHDDGNKSRRELIQEARDAMMKAMKLICVDELKDGLRDGTVTPKEANRLSRAANRIVKRFRQRLNSW